MSQFQQTVDRAEPLARQVPVSLSLSWVQGASYWMLVELMGYYGVLRERKPGDKIEFDAP